MNLGEDTVYVLDALCAADRISFSDIKAYRHFSNPDSLDNRFDSKKPYYMNLYYSCLFSFEDRFGIAGQEWAKARNSKISNEIIHTINSLVFSEVNEQETREFLRTLLSNNKIKVFFREGMLAEKNPFWLKLFASVNSVSAWRLYIAIRKRREKRKP
jgi:hypothetical protein